ncbi:anaphase-promoting complex subunit 15-like [Patiria miniata]|uniref:Anaphase-promoting complex subunit 15 n=1 Tax=Patiria miniata TaxID=46514 RepID=A0A913ZXJ4_PATMI|nr:anaphase-promoting complex subunit 15-like [Patiria miniata]
MSTNFPSLFPKLSDPLWFDIDKPFEDESQLAEEEREHQNWLKSIEEKNKDVIPIGKTTAEPYGDYDEDEEEDEDEIESEEESDEPDDLEVTDYDQDSPDDVEMDMNNDVEASNSPTWMM